MRKIIFIFLLFTIDLSAQETIMKFVNNSAQHILKRAHLNSVFISDSVKIEDIDEDNYDYRAVLNIKYKGFVKLHTLVCYIYFNDGPKKFVWGNDTNLFKIKTRDEAVLEELKELWRKFKIKNKLNYYDWSRYNIESSMKKRNILG